MRKQWNSSRHRFLPSRPDAMVLTFRDREMLSWVYRAKLATREQLQRQFFTAGGRSRAQRRLTLLYQHRFLDKLPGQPVSAPDIYYVSRHATRGLRLLRTLYPDETITPRRVPLLRVPHTLAIASCRIALSQACAAAGYTLSPWLNEEELALRLQPDRLLPDAYCQLTRPAPDGPKRAGFFLEVETSGKSERAMEDKLRRYGEFYYGGRYEREFGLRALRILVLFSAEYGLSPERQIDKYLAVCRRLEVTIVRVAALETLLAQTGKDLLFAPIWRQPKDESSCSLF